MSISNELMKAILSMDAYNRSYDESIELSGFSLGSAQLTTTVTDLGETILFDSRILQNSDEAIGFYALSYSYNGEAVIAFRGTDYPESGQTTLGIPNDVFHGWSLGNGNTDSEQGRMAIEFYKAVAETFELPGSNNIYLDANISLTGHSLGGGLAGFVASLYDQSATIFDSMDFEAASANAVLKTQVAGDPFGHDSILKDLIYGNDTPWLRDNNGITGYGIDGEILGLTPWSPPSNFITRFHTLNGIDLIPDEYSSAFDLLFNPGGLLADLTRNLRVEAIARHSQSTLIITMFADEDGQAGNTDWHASSQYFWPVLYDAGFAGEVIGGAQNVAGELLAQSKYAEILRTVIAYSAIDEGERPFGDTGIRALYDDANDLGAAIIVSGADSAIEVYATDISKAFVQFAGQLALAEIQKTGGADTVLAGVLMHNRSASDHSLTVDFTDDLWSESAGSVGITGMIARAALVGDVLLDTGANEELRSLIGTLWGDSSTNVFDYVVFATDDNAPAVLPESSSVNKTSLFVGDESSETVTGSAGNDLILGDGGNDVLLGNGGIDILYGGSGDDVLSTGIGSSVFDGGAGTDIADYSSLDAAISVHLEAGQPVTANKILFDGRSAGTDTLVAIDKIVGNSGATNFLNLYGPGTLQNLGNNRFEFEGTAFEFENFSYISGDSAGQLFDLGAPSGRVINGGGGDDVYNYFSGHVRDDVNGGVWDSNGRVFDSISDTDQLRITAPTILLNHNENIDSINLPDHAVLDYSASDVSAVFVVGETTSIFADGVPSNLESGVHLANGNTHNTLATRVIGTSQGDQFHLGIVGISVDRDSFMERIYTGSGDDLVTMPGSFADRQLDIHYNGGHDIYYVDQRVREIVLDNGISLQDVTVRSIERSLDPIGVRMILDVAGHGTLEWIAVTSGVHIDIRLADGSLIRPDSDFISNGLRSETPYTIVQGNGVIGGHVGTWGNDTWTGRDGVGESYSGKGGDDVINGGGGNDILIGGGGNDVLIAGVGNDQAFGDDGDDELDGGDGDDELHGGNGNDNIVAGDGNDEVFGDAGDDILDGANGFNQIFGGAGDDILIPGRGNDRLFGEDGDDTFWVNSGTSNHDSYDGGAGQDTVIFDQNFGNYFIRPKNGNFDVFEQDNFFDLSNIQTLQFKDGVLTNGIFVPSSESTTNDDEFLITSNQTFVLNLLSNDGPFVSRILAVQQSENATVTINAGLDSVTYTPNSGFTGDDSFGYAVRNQSGGIETATVHLSIFGAVLTGTASDDVLTGTTGNDVISALAGNDVLLSQGGIDILHGGAGADKYVLTETSSQVKIVDNSGLNRIFLENVSIQDIDYFPDDGDGLGDHFLFKRPDFDDPPPAGPFDPFFDPNLIAEIAGDVDFGVLVFDQTTTVYFDEIWDAQQGYVDPIVVSAGHDFVSVSRATPIDLLAGDDTFFGSEFDDFVEGGDGFDRLEGNGGDDILIGGGSEDFLLGGEGNDTYIFRPEPGFNRQYQDRIEEASGFDTISFQGGITFSDISFSRGGNGETLAISNPNNGVFGILNFFSEDQGFQVEQISFDDGTSFDLTSLISADSAPMETLDAYPVVFELGNTVAIVASQPSNGLALSVEGGIAYVPELGFTGNVTFDYGALDTDGQVEFARAGVAVNDPPSKIQGAPGRDVLLGDATDNVIAGEGGIDRISGEDGDDGLHGGDGIDFIDGGAGDDVIYSGPGRGILFGGEGEDLFVIEYPDSFDFVRDFEVGTDKVLLAIEDLLTEDGLLDGAKVQAIDSTGGDLLVQANLGTGFQTIANLNNAAGNSLSDVLFNEIEQIFV